MNIESTKHIVQQRLHGNQFTLLASDYSSDAIQKLFRKWFPAGQLVLEDAAFADTGANEVCIRGRMPEKLLEHTNLEVAVRLWSLENDTALALEFSQFPESFKLPQALPSLAGSICDALIFHQVRFTLESHPATTVTENFQQPWGYPPEKPAAEEDLKDGMRFCGNLALHDLPNNLNWLLAASDQSTLAVEGPIRFKFDRPIFWLKSDLGPSFDLAGLSVPLRFQLVSLLDYGKTAATLWLPKTCVRVVANLPLRQGEQPLLLPIVATIDRTNAYFLQIESYPGQVTAVGFGELSAALPAVDFSSVWPASFPQLSALQLSRLSFLLIPSARSFANISAEVAFNQSWELAEGLSIHSPAVIFNVDNPFSKAHRALGATLRAKLAIAGEDLDLRVDLPAMGFSASLGSGKSLPVAALVKQQFGLDLPMQNATAQQLLLEGDLKTKALYCFAQLAGNWEVSMPGTALLLTELIVSLNTDADGALEVTIQGRLRIGHFDFSAQVDYASGNNTWNVRAATYSAEGIHLTALASELAALFGVALPDSIPDIELKNAQFSFQTGAQNVALRGELKNTQPVELAGQTYTVETRLDLQHANQQWSGFTESWLTVADTTWKLRYALAAEGNTIEGSWNRTYGSGLTLAQMLEGFGLQTLVELPEGLNLTIGQLAFRYDTANKTLTLTAKTEHYGDAFVTASHANGSWNVVLGIDIRTEAGFALSDIPQVGAHLQELSFLHIQQLGLIVSSGKIPNYQVPALPPLQTAASGDENDKGFRPVEPLAASTNLVLEKGLSTIILVDFEQSSDPALQQLMQVLPQSTFTFQLTASSDALGLYAALDGTLALPTKAEPVLALQQPAIKIQKPFGSPQVVYMLSGRFGFELFDEPLDAEVLLTVDPDSVAASVTIAAPENGFPTIPGINGPQLTQLGALLGMQLAPPSLTMAMQGRFRLKPGEADTNQFGIAVGFVGQLPVPQYLAFNLARINMAELAEMVNAQPEASVQETISLVKGHELAFYWARTSTNLPDGSVVLPGFGFSGYFNVAGFGVFGDFQMRTGEGIRGTATSSPINLQGVLKLTGSGKGISREFEQVNGQWQPVSNTGASQSSESQAPRETRQIVQPGGPLFHFDLLSDPFIDIGWDISFFDLYGQQVQARVGASGISFAIGYRVSDAAHLQFSCTLGSAASFAASADLQLALDLTVPGFKVNSIPVGDLRIQSGLSGKVDLAIDTNKFALDIAGSFDFMGQRFTLAPLHLSTAPANLTELPQWIDDHLAAQAETLFAPLFTTTEDFFKGVGDGILQTTMSGAEACKDVYNLTAEESGKALQAAGQDAQQSLNELTTAFNLSKDAVVDLSQQLSMDGEVLSNTLRQQLGAGSFEVLELLKSRTQYSLSQIAQIAKYQGDMGIYLMRHMQTNWQVSTNQLFDTLRPVYNASVRDFSEWGKYCTIPPEEIGQNLLRLGEQAPNVLNQLRSDFAMSAEQVVNLGGQIGAQAVSISDVLVKQFGKSSMDAITMMHKQLSTPAEELAKAGKQFGDMGIYLLNHMKYQLGLPTDQLFDVFRSVYNASVRDFSEWGKYSQLPAEEIGQNLLRLGEQAPNVLNQLRSDFAMSAEQVVNLGGQIGAQAVSISDVLVKQFGKSSMDAITMMHNQLNTPAEELAKVGKQFGDMGIYLLNHMKYQLGLPTNQLFDVFRSVYNASVRDFSEWGKYSQLPAEEIGQNLLRLGEQAPNVLNQLRSDFAMSAEQVVNLGGQIGAQAVSISDVLVKQFGKSSMDAITMMHNQLHTPVAELAKAGKQFGDMGIYLTNHFRFALGIPTKEIFAAMKGAYSATHDDWYAWSEYSKFSPAEIASGFWGAGESVADALMDIRARLGLNDNQMSGIAHDMGAPIAEVGNFLTQRLNMPAMQALTELRNGYDASCQQLADASQQMNLYYEHVASHLKNMLNFNGKEVVASLHKSFHLDGSEAAAMAKYAEISTQDVVQFFKDVGASTDEIKQFTNNIYPANEVNDTISGAAHQAQQGAERVIDQVGKFLGF